MLYSEFIEGTGCKDSEYNFKIYKRLELMYMADDAITKAEIYEYGKKLVDNSKSQEQIAFENEIKRQIADLREQLKTFQADAKRYMEWHKEEPGDTYWKKQAQWQKDLVKTTKQQIAGLKFCLQ